MSRYLFLTLILVVFSALAASSVTQQLEDQMKQEEYTEVLVTFEGDIDDSTVEGIDDRYSIEHEFGLIEGAKMNLTSSEIENLSSRQPVERIEPDYPVETLVSDTGESFRMPELHNNGYMGYNSSVAVLDTGIYDHDYLDIYKAEDFTEEGTGDLNGHGTHVAGIIGSQHPTYTGISPEIDLYDAKVLNETGRGSSSQIIQGLEWVVEEEVDIASISIGAEVERCNGRDMLSRATNRATNSGTLTVTAAGNSGPDNSTITAPGCASNTLTVGSVDKEDKMAPYSSRGPTYDNRVKPDVVAPGSDIVSTWPENRWRYSSGTSMAAPHVSGQAAVILSETDKEPGEVKKKIMGTSHDLDYPENYQGSGKIDVYESLEGNFTSMGQTSTEQTGFLAVLRNIWYRLVDFILWM